jgi:chromosome segregation ATPase
MNDVPQVKLSKSDVVKRFSVSRVTLDRYINSGKISAIKGDRIGSSQPPKYQWSLDLSEVQRVFKERGSKAEKTTKKDNEVELQLLRQKVEMLEEQIRDKDEQVREAHRNKNDWKQQFEQSQARLEDLRDRSFFKKLFG